MDMPLCTDSTWDNIDSSVYDEELNRKHWLIHESFFKSRGYILAYHSSDAYKAIFADTSHIPMKPPQDPFHPRSDEAFWFIEPGVSPLREPSGLGNRIFPSPYVHLALDRLGRGVVLKAVRTSSTELAIIRVLSTGPLREDPRNHTIPVLEILDLGEWQIIVTAEWGFEHWDPCASVEEYLEFSRQLFEGLAFMHESGIFHGDIHKLNVLINHDGRRPNVKNICPSLRNFGPCGAKYAFIDFGESQVVQEGNVMRSPQDLSYHPQTVPPERFKEDPVNIFCYDVYSLGALLREQVDVNELFFAKYPGKFISLASSAPQYVNFVDAVTHEDPRERPTAAQALEWIDKLLREVDPKKLEIDPAVDT